MGCNLFIYIIKIAIFMNENLDNSNWQDIAADPAN